MKYYAVTEDPNELLHYGVKGMKWGQHLFGDDLRPKSPAYRRAASKLRSFSNKTKSAVSKSFTQRAMTRQQRQQDRFNKAVEKTQRRIALTENMHNLDQLTNYERSVSNAYKADSRKNRAEAKRERRYAKNERKMDKYTQLAREGRLKYGKLSEEQIARVHDRLALENTTRTLGGKELPKFRIRAKRALQEGLLSGITSGTAAGMTEIAKAKVQNHYFNKRALDKQSAQRAEREKQATRIKNKKSHKEIRQDLAQEAYEASVASGQNVFERSRLLHPITNINAGKRLQRAEAYKKLSDQKQQYKLLYDGDGEPTSLNEYSQKLESARMRQEAKNALNKRLNEIDAYNDLASFDKLRLETFDDDKRERKRQQDLQDRLRNESDEEWNRYVKEGGNTRYLDKATNTIIDLNKSDTDLAKNNPKALREARSQTLTANKKAQDEAEKDAYNERVAEEKRRLEQEAFEKAKEDGDKRYERAFKKYTEDKKADDEALADYNRRVREDTAKNSWNPNYVSSIKPPTLRNPKKPDYADYEVTAQSFSQTYKPPKIESYEEYKRLNSIGMPTYFPYNKNNNGGGKGKKKG